MADSPEEKAHWRSVLKAFDGYMQYHLSANHARRMAFLSLPKEQRTMYESIGFRDKLEAVDEGIRRNAEFIDEMIADPVFADMMADEAPQHSHDHGHHGHDHGHSHGDELQHEEHVHSQSHGSHGGHGSHGSHGSHGDDAKKSRQAENDLAQDKVRSTLRSIVRDWAAEGAQERANCYKPCLEALERHFPQTSQGSSVDPPAGEHGKDRKDLKVLVPGCGLGRLAMEIAARGFSSQGNEFSTYMLLASHFMLNQTTRGNSHHIFPFLHSFSNHPSTEKSVLRRVDIPDVCPANVLGDGKGGEFSLVAGDFEELYSDPAHAGAWSAVVTCFFIDCARNILTFLKIIYDLLDDDGVWINVGPLLWHFENSPTTSAKGEGSIELSLDEVKELARNVGFAIHDERDIQTTYTGIPGNMLKHEYNAAFWTATKRKAVPT